MLRLKNRKRFDEKTRIPSSTLSSSFIDADCSSNFLPDVSK
jgi:hypothetical protein